MRNNAYRNSISNVEELQNQINSRSSTKLDSDLTQEELNHSKSE